QQEPQYNLPLDSRGPIHQSASMGKIYLFLFSFLSIITVDLQAQPEEKGKYKVTVEVIKVCGFGTPDGDSNSYRWRFIGKLRGQTVNWWDGTIGISNATGGTCLGLGDNQAEGRVGARLPKSIFSSDYTYAENTELKLEIQA